jgi:hypothetical protein
MFLVTDESEERQGNEIWANDKDEIDLWDNDNVGGISSTGFDLSDFAAATENFSKQTKNIFLDGGCVLDSYIDTKKLEDEAMERLLKEQGGITLFVTFTNSHLFLL